jgi:hypothetical protein
MKYDFNKIKKKKGYVGCSVCDKYIYLSRELLINNDLLNCLSCDVLTDKENKVVSFLFYPDRIGKYKLTAMKKGFIVNASLSGLLPRGRYIFKNDTTTNKIICVYEDRGKNEK